MTEPTGKPTRHTVLRITVIFFLICIATLIFIGGQLIRQQVRELVGNPDPGLRSSQLVFLETTFFIKQSKISHRGDIGQPRDFIISDGEPLDDVINDLVNQGLVTDRALFRSMLIYTGADRRILPGKYLISGGSSLREVLFILQDASSSLVNFVILPGWRKEEIAEALPTSGLNISIEEFLAKVNQPINDPDLVGSETLSLEGFLTPGNYSFRRDVTPDDLIAAFVNRFKQTVTAEMQEAYTSRGLTIYQAVILASIIQREAMIDEEKPLIASVFLNRLQTGMPLQSDPTVQYSLGYSPEWGWWKSPLSLQDLEIDSPYNTYKINGLPPAPISNPDSSSLQAVAFPEDSTYLYFRAECDNSGKHVFSETMEEHTMNGCSKSGS